MTIRAVTTQLERIASLETLVAELKDGQIEMNKKMDELLALRNKGAGVLWLVATIFGVLVMATSGVLHGWGK